MTIAGKNPDRNLVEIVEIPDHPWYVAVQFHPELKSRPNRPHPLFRDFVGAAIFRSSAILRSKMHTAILSVRRLSIRSRFNKQKRRFQQSGWERRSFGMRVGSARKKSGSMGVRCEGVSGASADVRLFSLPLSRLRRDEIPCNKKDQHWESCSSCWLVAPIWRDHVELNERAAGGRSCGSAKLQVLR